MSSEIFPTRGRIVLAEKAVTLPFLFALSRGNPAWDGLWNGQNPPTPQLEATDVLSLIGFARPSLQDFLKIDDAGTIVTSNGTKFATSTERTRFIRVRLSLPSGTFAGETVREIGLFANPQIDGSVAPGEIVIPNDKVISRGDLFQLHWRPALPIEEGDFFARNFVVRI